MPVSDPNPLLQAAFEGCASQVGPMIQAELSIGAVCVQTSSELPGGDIAVIPILVESGTDSTMVATLSAPLCELATLGRRMVGDDDPDNKERALSSGDLDAIGEVLNLMSGGIDAAIRAHVRPDLGGKPGQWWRTDDPREQTFSEGEFLVGETTLSAPEGTPVNLLLRIPLALLDLGGSEGNAQRSLGRVLLLGLEGEIQAVLRQTLTEAQGEVETIEPDDPRLLEQCSAASCVLIGEASGLEVCRRIRASNETWQVPTVLCLKEPTRASVLQALDCGASHVLVVPCNEIDLLKVLRAAQSRGAGWA